MYLLCFVYIVGSHDISFDQMDPEVLIVLQIRYDYGVLQNSPTPWSIIIYMARPPANSNNSADMVTKD